MKKTYIAPRFECVKMDVSQMLAGSNPSTITIDKDDTTNSAFGEKKDWSKEIWGE